jgi:hypothetical protein
MFEVTKEDLLLKNVTLRTENHGDEKVPAASLKLEYEGQNSILNQFDAKLLPSLYEAKDKEQAELIQDDLLPDLKFNHIKPLAWDDEYEGYRVRLVNDLEPEEARFIFDDCVLKGFKFELKDRGFVKVSFTINCRPEPEAIAWLYNQLEHNALITLEPPEETQLHDLAEQMGGVGSLKDDTPDAFEGFDQEMAAAEASMQ